MVLCKLSILHLYCNLYLCYNNTVLFLTIYRMFTEVILTRWLFMASLIIISNEKKSKKSIYHKRRYCDTIVIEP